MDEQHDSEKTDRPRREAAKQVTDFREFHARGVSQLTTSHNTGKVAAAVLRIETPEKIITEEQHTTRTKARRNLSGEPGTPPLTVQTPPPGSPIREEMADLEKLKEELRQQKDLNEKIKHDLEAARLKQELLTEQMKQKEWETAKDKIASEQAAAIQRHEETLRQLQEAKAPEESNPTITYLKEKLAELSGTKAELEPTKPEVSAKEAKQKQIADELQALIQKQHEIAEAARVAAKEHSDNPHIRELLSQFTRLDEQKPEEPSGQTLEQLLSTLQGKTMETKAKQQKEILQQFLIDANKITTTGGINTLKPDLLKKLTGESEVFNMGEWLAKLNRQDQEDRKCDDCQQDCKHGKKSGMLDKATTNIQHKEVWPQKNLLEDWADEEMEFKHMQFEHLVAGETRTIETSTDPAQILGRLRLLRRMAYAKLRGYEWSLIRKMYAAILRSIETRENSWESNFDRYETILYRKTINKKEDRQSMGQTGKKWFCRDWNKGNCTKNSPHKSWFGTGQNAIQRTVLHMCATCYIKDKKEKEHQEGSDNCPHKEA